MPICKRENFDNSRIKNKNETFQDNDEVFFCETTKEIFKDYEDYFRHVMAINSTVWQCEETGRDNLTYAEALKSERKARKKIAQFKEILRAPIMLVIDQSKQSSIKALNAIIFKFIRRRFFINEEVLACNNSTKYHAHQVLEIIPPANFVPGNGVYEDTENLQYKLRRVGNNNNEIITVPFDSIRRNRFEFTTDNLQMFIKSNVTRVDGILRPKPESFQKYVTDKEITFGKIFIGQMPRFSPAKIRRPQDDQKKKQSTMNNYLVKSSEAKGSSSKQSAEEIARREKEKAEKAEAKEKSLREEMERLRREKQEKLLALEKEKSEKRAKLMEKIEAECTALLTKTDDLERTDQRMLPTYTPIETYIPNTILGDAFTVREFLQTFSGILSGIDVFRGGLGFFEMSRAFTTREVAGPLSDILLILLGTVFDLQKEEEEECKVSYLLLRKELRKREPYITMSAATRAQFYCKRHFSFKLNELPIDAQTVSEVLRLHLLGSGAIVHEKAEKWRMLYRNGYTSIEDPGLFLRMQHPHIIRALKSHTVFQLPFADIIRIMNCLMAQVKTYSSPLNLIEERMEQMAKARYELRTLNIAENRRVFNLQTQKRILANECNQHCMEDDVKNNPEKKAQLFEKLNKKIAELMAQSDRDRKKYESQVEDLNSSIFNYLVYLGMDRAYRKYYVLESIPGIFVEHPPDCMDTCLTEPPVNVASDVARATAPDLPRHKKDLRTYLMKIYTEEEKKAANKYKSTATVAAASSLHENKENCKNGVVNGLLNGHDPALMNGLDGAKDEKIDVAETETKPVEPPTQYQLYMCTGDPSNCIVHDENNPDRQLWAYLYQKEDIDALIESLNQLGERESQLREQLTTLRPLILNHVRRCPFDMLSIGSKKEKFKNQMMTDTYRKYHKANFGFTVGIDQDLNEVMFGSLVDRIIQFEQDIYTGDLGRLKVKDMKKWREDLINNKYDPQGKLQWGPSGQKQSTAGEEEEGDDDIEDIDEEITDDKCEGNDGNKPYRDPGQGVGENITHIDSDDGALSLEESSAILTHVRNLASALLQVEQAIERRFIKEPFGAPMKDTKDKELLERRIKCGANRLKQWELSLMESTSYAQVFLHLNVLHDSIIWARSTNKSNCQVCRRGSDPDKMLLCDNCNGGTHMFCMKPKMKTVPDGNWYCAKCEKRYGLKNEAQIKVKAAPKRKRTFNLDEEDDSSNYSPAPRGRARGRQKKILPSSEIEGALDEDESEREEENENAEDEYENERIEENSDEADEDDEEEANEAENQRAAGDEQNDNEDELDEEEDESVCIICSYDGGDIICGRCKDAFHKECVNLKRTPRYNYVCTKCKGKEDKKRRSKYDDSSSEDGDTTESSEPLVKRSRHSRNSLTNGTSADRRRSSNQRRKNRRTGENLPLDSALLYELLADIMKSEHAWPFLRPVSSSEVPDYYKIITTPMDLAKVKSKLNMGKYQLNEEVISDIQLIFNNCDQYNVKGNEIYNAGCSLEKFVIKRCKELGVHFKPSDMNN